MGAFLNTSGLNRAGRFGRLHFWILTFAIGAALFAFGALAQQSASEGAPSRDGVILSLNGPVTPTSAAYLSREISAASDAGKELVIVEIDTPGGLVDSMKTIIKSILASDTPVATYVSPQGARSASAGLYIMYAAHVSAMAPSTNTGAATPVEVGGGGGGGDENPFEDADPVDDADEPQSAPAGEEDAPESAPESAPEGAAPGDGAAGDGVESVAEEVSEAVEEVRPAPAPRGEDNPLSNDDALRAKIINDSVAYIRSLAEERGRNADWAERAVRDAVSITSREALELNVIDIVADDLDDLLTQIDGREVVTASGAKTLSTENLRLERVEPTQWERILGFFANPNVAVILMSLATTGIIIEMWNPGSIFPGVMGALCLILGLYSFQVLPYNGLGAALMILGVILMAVEAYTPTFGLAGLVGLILFGAGLFTIFPAGFEVSPSVIAGLLATVGGLLALVLFAVIGSRSHGPMIGGEAIRRREGVVDDWDGKEGWVIVEGERWRARSDRPLSPGDKIRVVEIDGLVLIVKQAKGPSLLGGLMPSEA